MARPEAEDFQLYFNRVRPVYHQIFNLAHAISGNADQAEYCLQYAMLDCWAAGDSGASRHGFREGLRSSASRAAQKLAEEERAEFDWEGLHPDPESDDPILQQIAQETIETQRILALRHGCGLSPRRIAKLTALDAKRVQALLRRFEARTRRRLSAGDSRRFDHLIVQRIRNLMSQPSPAAPEMGSVFRTFQADAASMSRPSRLPVRIARWVFALILALFCMAAFWLAAVLIQPPVLEEPAAPPTAEAELEETT